RIRDKHDIAVAAHHAFGLAGAARGVYKARQIEVDVPDGRTNAREICLDRIVTELAIAVAEVLGLGSGDYNQIKMSIAPAQFRDCPMRRGLRVRDQSARLAISENVRELVEFRGGVNQNERRAGLENCEDRDNSLDTVEQIYGDALSAPDA